ncbi:putative phosphoinositide phosphatase SAC9 [Iris pallida]|uniref:Phosphoinositide phosphatase SAC9 n=1 Tax=Iris pallida TaxID=29817 RepID=A0AAX6HRE3_IRIPA|nr:putative phosphoinositide phosphatase SAC9 [Iris pallida]
MVYEWAVSIFLLEPSHGSSNRNDDTIGNLCTSFSICHKVLSLSRTPAETPQIPVDFSSRL